MKRIRNILGSLIIFLIFWIIFWASGDFWEQYIDIGSSHEGSFMYSVALFSQLVLPFVWIVLLIIYFILNKIVSKKESVVQESLSAGESVTEKAEEVQQL